MGDANCTPTKKCTKCGEAKPLEDFSNSKANKHKDGKSPWCKKCASAANKVWRDAGGEQLSASRRKAKYAENPRQTKKCTKCGKDRPATVEYFHKHSRSPDGLRSVCRGCRAKEHASRKDEHAVKRKEFYAENRDRLVATCREYYRENVEAQRADARARHHRNRDANLIRMQNYRVENRESVLAAQRVRENVRRKLMYGVDIAFTLRHRVGALFRVSLKNRKKSKRMEEIVGYSLDDLRSHIERKFDRGMTWEHFMRGEIHIDHIRPISSFNITSCECDEFKKCWALSNLQPLWAKENLSKGAKILTEP